MQTSEVGGPSNPTYRDEDEPDVTASINVDDEIVRGTASVQQSHDGLQIMGGTTDGLINVQLNDDGQDRKRVLSQADRRSQGVNNYSNFVVSDRDTHDQREDPRSMLLNKTGGGTTNETPLSETVRADPLNNGMRVSFEDDWEEKLGKGFPSTANQSNEPNIVLSSNQRSGVAKEEQSENPLSEVRQLEQDQEDLQRLDGQHEQNGVEKGEAQDSEEYSDDEDHSADLPDMTKAAKERDPYRNQAEIKECDIEQSQYTEPSQGNLEDSVPGEVTINLDQMAHVAQDQDAQNVPRLGHETNPDSSHLLIKDEGTLGQQVAMDKNIIVQDELERLIVNLNHTAMACLKNDSFEKARRLLVKAETNLLQVDTQVSELQATSQSISNLGDPQFANRAGIGPLDALKNRLLGLTYNNLGCLCKQQQDFQGALAFLKEALKYESRLEFNAEEERNLGEVMDADVNAFEFQMDLRTLKCNSSGTILNICAILSKLKLHKQAHEYAVEAVAKLRHSMKLTKTQVLQTQGKLEQILDRLEALRDSEDKESLAKQDPEKVMLKQELLKCETDKLDLENQWVNLATTAVIAHYNAAVELEFMSMWREALSEYEKSAQLSSLSMKSNNPMAVKIKQAIIKMRIKVRNNVQLPEKLASEALSSMQRKPGKSYIGSNRVQAAFKDFQNSVYSTKSSQFQQQYNRLAAKSNEYTSPRTTTISGTFHPSTSLENPITSLETIPIGYQPATGMRNSEQTSSGNQQRKVGLRPLINRGSKDKSPISLRRIIDKLEHTEMLEARKQSNALPRHTRFKSQRNPLVYNTVSSHIGDDLSGPTNGLTSALFNERKTSNAMSSNMYSGKESRNSNARHTLNSAGINAVDPNFLPTLNSTTGIQSTRNSHRGSTVQGLRPNKSTLNQLCDRQTTTGVPKKRGAVSKPPMANAWAVTAAEPSHNRAISVGEHQKFNTIDSSAVSARKTSLKMSPTKLQMHLSIHNERRLIQQQNRQGTHQQKREQDITFFLNHIKRQGVKSKKSTRTTMLNTVSTDLTSVRQQLRLESSASHLAGSAYLPQSLKNSIKQRQFVSQIKTMQKQITKEMQQYEPTLQMETQFQRQMALWRQEREQQIAGKLSEMESFKADKPQYTQPFSAAKNSQHHVLAADKMSLDSVDILSAEQAQEAISIAQDSQSKLTDKQGNQTGDDEEEVGNFRVSPAQTASLKANDLRTNQEREERATLIGHGQIQILEEYGENDDDTLPGGKDSDDEHERPDTRAEVLLRSDDKTESGRNLPQATCTSAAIISEYVSSQNEQHHHQQHTADFMGDAPSGTAQEVDLEQPMNKQLSETIEVEDIVSADTNNRQPENIFQSFRTSSKGLRNGDTTPQESILNNSKLYKDRFNTNSAMHAEENPRDMDVNRSHNARSSFAMMMTNLDPMSGDQPVKNKHESMTAVSPLRLKNEPNISPQVHQEVTFQKMRRSQMTGGGSSIVESNASQTEMTVNEDGDQGRNGNDFAESTLNEETLNGWKIQKDSLTHSRQEPELTDDQVTILAEQSLIGDGPIYIQKSGEHGRATQRIRKTKTHLFDHQDARQMRPESRQVSEVTGTTDQIVYGYDSAMGIQDTNQTQKNKQTKKTRNSLAEKSLAETSELINVQLAGGLSIEAQSIPDTVSDVTYKQTKVLKNDRIQKNKDFRSNERSYVTPRTSNLGSMVKKSVLTIATHERSSLDTEKASRALPGHIHHSKKASVTRPPVSKGPSQGTTKRYVAVLAQKQQTLRPNLVKPLNLPSRNQNMPQTTKSSNIPSMIHVQQAIKSPTSNLTSPTQFGQKTKVTRQKTEIFTRNRERASKNQSLGLDAVVDYSREFVDMKGTMEVEKPSNQTDDRVAKIAQQITKLNTTLLQFQSEAEELKKDPMLKSTQRSNASRHGLISQKSRDTNMTMPVVDAANVKALQEKRLMAQLQSAPGRSRRGRDSYMMDGRVELGTIQQKPSETPLAVRKQTEFMSNDGRNDVTVQSEIKSIETNR